MQSRPVLDHTFGANWTTRPDASEQYTIFDPTRSMLHSGFTHFVLY